MAENNNEKMTKKTTQASAQKHYWGKNAHLANKDNNKPTQTKTTTVIVGTTSKSAKKAIKKTNSKTIFIVVLCFVLAIVFGVGLCFFMGRNDEFTINGSEEVVLSLGQTYKDEGVKIVEFGFDISQSATLETDLKINDNGEFYADYADKFYIAYTVKSVKFGFVYNVQKIRFVTFEGESEGGE